MYGSQVEKEREREVANFDFLWFKFSHAVPFCIYIKHRKFESMCNNKIVIFYLHKIEIAQLKWRKH